jgi:signal transduction histidine kinase
MPLTIERKLPLTLFFVVIVLTVLGFVLYEYTTSLQDALDIEKRTQNFVGRLDDTLRFSLDIESALTGFVITGNQTYLEPYQKGKSKIPQVIAQMRAMAFDDPAELEELARLEVWTAEYVAQVDRKIELRKQDGFDAAIMTLSDSPERSVTANIRASIDRLKNIELTALQRREKMLDQSFFRTIWVLIIGCLAGIVALGAANILVSREIGRRRNAEAALIDSNKNLETKIEERTDDLKNLNESLRQAADEREALLESEQSARREAEIANRLRDEFMAAVSHELKTPLNSILGWARMLKAGDLDEDQAKKALGTIIKNSETQNRLIEDLLDVARVISGKLVLEFEPIDPLELVDDAIEIVTPSARAKRISITRQANEAAVYTTVDGDRDRLMQVFSNLLNNAVKFSSAGTSVEVHVTSGDADFVVRIKDNGIGISKEFLPVVFERFRQDSSVTERNGGLGLGLAIVRQLVEMHGGTVGVESEGLNKGSEFTVRLPARHREGSHQ